ncbi:MAG: DUF4292 domain-containing protein [Flavobacteriales bacterium]|nr:DUF4292 domain-containing protein [Flavobacteriia bacterium]NCP06101.1 DUF4292 domain-containing protein [Flavobacteriales bacterium]PIV94560.1 MAG: DUF4292 domain-containing protein [Flavobacteriaceae bacterium CG17_big_fil_post_rev_8_21_14_2_50_33_15]PIY10521.1 MAG: DUF4292 domain-containing protein [Flavobacteriaceae bacterium CG_4_10_14_3_um_filter_33_47]PJB16378.1 MAG: DUF4292 domain-containing protein [Flavobacteriaceae bacterium CG_4_9_14_3_um_filter_33_16]
MHLKKRLLVLVILSIMVLSCKSTKNLGSGKSNLGLSTKQLIKENFKNKAVFKTLSARVKIDVSQGDKSNKYTVNLRLEKDKKLLLMSTPITLVKALITPEKVSFYNKLENTYFEGDFSYLSQLLGTEIDFQKLQNLILGEALFSLNNEFNLLVNEDNYVLQPKKQHPLFELFYIISSSHFKLTSQQISQPQERRHLQIDYKSYQEVDKQILPENIKIMAVEEAEELVLEITFKAVSLNEDLRFPFKIPSGFKEIKL